MSLGLHAVTFGALDRAARSTPPAFEPTAQSVSGDTLEVEPPTSDVGETDGTGESPAPPAAEPANGAVSAARPSSRLVAPTASATAGRATLFGAVGVRFATDLATTFTRAFPQAASADPAWEAAAFGTSGSADVTLVLDDEGHLTSRAVVGSPSVALRRGIERTLSLLGPRAFTARDPVTRIRISARVSRDEVHDGLHGDVFALSGGSFAGDVGAAFFALPPAAGPGRRVDVELRLLR